MAELKNTIVNGVLNVNGDMVASKIVRRGGTDNQILMADGSVSLLSDITTLINAGLNLKGTLGTSGATINALPTASVNVLGDAYKVVSDNAFVIPGTSNQKAKIGDLFVCYTTDNTNYNWMHIPSGDDIEDTWRPIWLNNTQVIGTALDSGSLKFAAGDNITITHDSGTLTFKATDTTYGAEKGITLTDKKFGHTNSITKVTTPGLYKIAYDDYGHITSTESFTLPVVNDNTLTMGTSGTGISGSATFTANSNKDATFTVTLNSNAEGNRTQGQVVIAKDTGLVAIDKLAISHNTSTKATWQYNNTDDCIELVW